MKKKLYYAALTVFALTFAVSAFFLIRYYVESSRAQASYQDLSALVSQAQSALPESQAGLESALIEVTNPKTGESIGVLAEYAPIYQRNPDTVGWIAVEGTNIDFPVLHRPEVRDYYLYRDFYGNSSAHGAIYVREECDPLKPSDNVVIYGHRMRDGTMFAKLHQYKDRAFRDAHPYIRFDSLTEYRTYEIMSVFTIESTEDSGFLYHEFADAATEEDYNTFVSQCKAYALYDTGVDAQWGDKLITLSTCDGPTGGVGRLVVVAKQVSE